MKNLIYITFLVFGIFANAQTATVNYTYDNLYRLTKATYPNGSYIAYTYDANGNRMQTVSATLAVEETTGSKNIFSVFPNPFYDEINVTSKTQKIIKIQLLDYSGKLYKEIMLNTTNYTFHAETLPSGLYMLVVVSENGRETFKVIKK